MIQILSLSGRSHSSSQTKIARGCSGLAAATLLGLDVLHREGLSISEGNETLVEENVKTPDSAVAISNWQRGC